MASKVVILTGVRGLIATIIALSLLTAFPGLERPLSAQDSVQTSREMKANIKTFRKQAGKDRRSGDYQKAAALSAQLLPLIATTKGRQSEDYANALVVHSVDLMNAGRAREAEPIVREALKLHQDIFGLRHPETLTAYNNLAANLFGQGRYADAEPIYRKVLALRQEVLGRKHRETASSLSNLALNLMLQGRRSEAEPLNREALALRTDILGSEHEETVSSLNNLAGNLQLQERYAEAEPLFRQALSIRTKISGKQHPETLVVLDNLATILNKLERFEEAEPLHRRAYAASIGILGDKHPNTLVSMGMLAGNLKKQRRYDEAEALERRAVQYMTEVMGEAHHTTLAAMGNLGLTLNYMGKDTEAEEIYRRVLTLRAETLGEDHPDTLSTQGNLAYNLIEQAERANLAIIPARAVLTGWLDRWNMRGNDAREELQYQREMKNRRHYFTLFADAGWIAARDGPDQRAELQEEVYGALQRAMTGPATRAVAQTAARRAAENEVAGLDELLRQRQSLANQWQSTEALINKRLAGIQQRPDRRLKTLRQKKAALVEKIEAVDVRVGKDFPQYFAMVRPEPLSIAETQAMLGPDDAFLMVVPTQMGAHVFAVSRQDVRWVRSTATRKTINAMVKRLLWDVGANVDVSNIQAAEWADEGKGAYPYDRSTAYHLYQQLIGPMRDVLRDKRHVYIAAGGALSGLPFGILVSAEPTGDDGDPTVLRATRWFADDHALISIPSIQSLQFLKQYGSEKTPANQERVSFLGFGDPLLDGSAEIRGGGRGRHRGATAASIFTANGVNAEAGIANVDDIKKLARLPGTAVELEQMRQALNAPPSAVLTAAKASEASVRASDLTSARILAFATHGLLAGEIEGAREPGLVFSPPSTATDKDDGFLSASEVAALRLDADWVILSACNTASGDGSSGAPGLSGLARSFFYAGARNLLASHWPVRDKVAARLTVRTIEIARDNPNLSRAEAFQHAMREIRADRSNDSEIDTWAHPNAWAPFALIGEGT